MTPRFLPLALLACLAASSAHAGAPAYDLKIEVIRDGKPSRKAVVPLPANMVAGQPIAFAVGDYTPYVNLTTQDHNDDGNRAPLQFCSTYFSGLKGKVAKTDAGALQVETQVSELLSLNHFDGMNDAGFVEAPDLDTQSGTFELRGDWSTHPASGFSGFYSGHDRKPGQASKVTVKAQVVDRTWLRSLAMGLGIGDSAPVESTMNLQACRRDKPNGRLTLLEGTYDQLR